MSVLAVVVQLLGEPVHLILDVPVELGSSVGRVLVDILEEWIRSRQPLDDRLHVVGHSILGALDQDPLRYQLIQCTRDDSLLLIRSSNGGFITGIVGDPIWGMFVLHPL